MFRGFPHGSDSKESACNAGDLGSIPRLASPDFLSSLQPELQCVLILFSSSNSPSSPLFWIFGPIFPLPGNSPLSFIDWLLLSGHMWNMGLPSRTSPPWDETPPLPYPLSWLSCIRSFLVFFLLQPGRATAVSLPLIPAPNWEPGAQEGSASSARFWKRPGCRWITFQSQMLLFPLELGT